MPEKPLRFTRHARNRMRYRHITVEMIDECLNGPENVEAMPGGMTNAWKRVAGEYLRVVYVEEEDARVVVTVIYPAKAPKGTQDED